MDKEILQQYIEGKLDRLQKEKVAEWLDKDAENMQEYLLLRGIYDATLWNGPEHQAISNHGKQIRLLREFLKIAAIFIVAFGCSYYLISKQRKNTEPEVNMQTVYAPEGQRAEVMLSDGTKVWLNAKTSLSFPDQFKGGERRVELDGEAYFEVTKDTTKHFIVSFEDYRVKVLGTEFNVKAYSQNKYFEAALLKGSVEVASNYTNEKIVLTPNTYVYAKEGKLVKTTLWDMDQFL